MNSRCTYCGSGPLEPGFVEDTGQESRGYGRWIEGSLERGAFGYAKRRRRTRWQMDAFRCARCGHLEMFATHRA